MEQKPSNGYSKDLSDLRKAILLLCDKFEDQETRIAQLEKRFAGKEYIFEQQPSLSSPVPSVTLPPPPPPPVQTTAASIAKQADAGQPDSTVPAPTSLEEKIGGNLFAKVGIVALVLGISFFVKYAFDNDWVGPTGRVLSGIIAGIGLLIWGEKTVRKYAAYGQIMTGGGIAVLYVSLYAAQNYYDLISQIPAFLAMMLVTALGLALSIRYDAPTILVESIIGGFATPFLVSSGQNEQFILFSYVLLLDVAVLWISMQKNWRVVNVLGYLGTVITFLSWFTEYYDRTQLFSTFIFLSLFFLIYSFSSMIYNLVRNQRSSGFEQIMSILAAVFYFSESYVLLNVYHHEFLGFFALMLAFYYFLLGYFVKAITPEDQPLYQLLLLIALGFITLVVPLQFDLQVITWAWSIEAIILTFLAIKTNHELIQRTSVIIYVLALFHLLFFDTSLKLDNPAFLLNKRFATFVGVILLSYVGAVLYAKLRSDQPQEDTSIKKQTAQMIAVYVIVANFLTIFSVSQEIAIYYGRAIAQEQRIQYQQNQSQDQFYESRGMNAPSSYRYDWNNEEIQKLKNRRDIALSLYWLLYSIVVVTVGFVTRNRLARVGGMLLLMLAILKLFFYDLWSLGTLYRIISSISLGVVLLAISFAYQKYKDKLKEIIE